MKFRLLLVTVLLTEGETQARAKGLYKKVQQLADMSSSQTLLSLKRNTFEEFVKSSPRNYSFIIMFTATAPTRLCTVCDALYDEYEIVANSFKVPQAYPNRLFFGVVDFDGEPEIFQILHLTSVPLIMHFPSKGKPKASDTMNFDRFGASSEAIAKWIHARCDIHIKIFRPPRYYTAVALAAFTIFFTACLCLRSSYFGFLYSRTIWACGAVGFCLAMASGQTWNGIREPPLVRRIADGFVFIEEGLNDQLVLESYIVLFLNAAVVVGFIVLIEASGGVKGLYTKKQDDGTRRIKAFVGLVLVCTFFSMILSILRYKIPNYPFRFLFTELDL